VEKHTGHVDLRSGDKSGHSRESYNTSVSEQGCSDTNRKQLRSMLGRLVASINDGGQELESELYK
jgi:hypothetical protein